VTKKEDKGTTFQVVEEYENKRAGKKKVSVGGEKKGTRGKTIGGSRSPVRWIGGGGKKKKGGK